MTTIETLYLHSEPSEALLPIIMKVMMEDFKPFIGSFTHLLKDCYNADESVNEEKMKAGLMALMQPYMHGPDGKFNDAAALKRMVIIFEALKGRMVPGPDSIIPDGTQHEFVESVKPEEYKPHVDPEIEAWRAEFIELSKSHLDMSLDKDAWGRDKFMHAHIESMFHGYCVAMRKQKGDSKAKPTTTRLVPAQEDTSDWLKALWEVTLLTECEMTISKETAYLMAKEYPLAVPPVGQQMKAVWHGQALVAVDHSHAGQKRFVFKTGMNVMAFNPSAENMGASVKLRMGIGKVTVVFNEDALIKSKSASVKAARGSTIELVPMDDWWVPSSATSIVE